MCTKVFILVSIFNFILEFVFINGFNIDFRDTVNGLDQQFNLSYKNFALIGIRLNFVSLINS